MLLFSITSTTLYFQQAAVAAAVAASACWLATRRHRQAS
jgi:hypothetical protein